MWLAMTLGFFIIWEFQFLGTIVESWLLCSWGWLPVGAQEMGACEHRSGERGLQPWALGRGLLCQSLRERLWVPQSGPELIPVEEIKGADLTDDKPPQAGRRPSLPGQRQTWRRKSWRRGPGAAGSCNGAAPIRGQWHHSGVRVWPWLCLCGPPCGRWWGSGAIYACWVLVC